ncbi:MAG: tyrosine-type recombinase/integrase [Acidimicrobiales bacterium]
MHPSEGRGLDRGDLGRFLFTAERFDHGQAALAVLFGLNGLRVSEACETNIEDMAFERGHRVLRIIAKGNKPALIPIVPRTARTIDLAVGERREGPILLRHDGRRLDRRTAHRRVRSIGKRGGIGLVHPHMLRAAFIMAALDAGVPLREVQIAALMLIPGRRLCTIGDARTSTSTPPTSSSLSSPAADLRPTSSRTSLPRAYRHGRPEGRPQGVPISPMARVPDRRPRATGARQFEHLAAQLRRSAPLTAARITIVAGFEQGNEPVRAIGHAILPLSSPNVVLLTTRGR